MIFHASLQNLFCSKCSLMMIIARWITSNLKIHPNICSTSEHLGHSSLLDSLVYQCLKGFCTLKAELSWIEQKWSTLETNTHKAYVACTLNTRLRQAIWGWIEWVDWVVFVFTTDSADDFQFCPYSSDIPLLLLVQFVD